MHIDVSEILAHETGYRASFKVEGERPELTDVELASDLDGEIEFVRTNFGLGLNGNLNGKVTLECHRCLRAFPADVSVELNGAFAFEPREDQWPIRQERHKHFVDLAPMVRQEMILAAPIQVVCEPGCLGLCKVCGLRQEGELHHHDQEKVTKG